LHKEKGEKKSDGGAGSQVQLKRIMGGGVGAQRNLTQARARGVVAGTSRHKLVKGRQTNKSGGGGGCEPTKVEKLSPM